MYKDDDEQENSANGGDERYARKMKELNEKLDDPKIQKQIDSWIDKMSAKLGCSVEVMFNVHPEIDEYEEFMESGEFEIPRNVVTMKLKDVIEILSFEDGEFKVFMDPIFLKKGLNEINNMLTTTVNDNLIVIPVSHLKKKED